MTNEVIRGHVVLLMAPTGSGKKVLETAAREAYPHLRFLVSCTTRSPRPGEVHGQDYYFLSREDFEGKASAGEFFEWAEFGGNLYGTLKSELLEPLYKGEVVLNEIEVQGVEQFLELIPREHMTIVYIDAGDWEVIKARVLARAPITEVELELRHKRYLIERESRLYADVVINNHDGKMEEAQNEFVALIGSLTTKHL